MKRIQFFAVEDDLVNVLNAVEQTANLQYVKTGTYSSRSPEIYDAGTRLPELGIATADSGIISDSFLIAERGMPIEFRSVALNSGGTDFRIDQLGNPDTVVLTPTGRWNGAAVLYGTVNTASASEASIKLMKAFARAFKKHFKKIEASWVGPKALELLEAGERFTIAVQSPKEFDLSIP